MNIVSDQSVIDRYIKEKALNEFKLAKALCELFDTTGFPLRGQLQTIAKTALSTLVQFNKILKDQVKYPKTSALAASVYAKESKLKILKDVVLGGVDVKAVNDPNVGPNLDNATRQLEALIANLPNTQGIGEIVRLFAAVCETVKDSNDARTEVSKLIFVKNPDGTKLISLGDFCSTLGAYRTTAYGIKAFDAKARVRRDSKTGMDGRPKPDFGGRIIDADIAAALGFPPNQKVAAGNNFFSPLLPGDVVRCIDTILGLPEGASISGTTSDTIWAIETLSNFLYYNDVKKSNEADPNLHLLAVAAIVSGYHHTVLEVGLPLTINSQGDIAYQPGVYTSLQDGLMAGTPAGLLIRKVLSDYENTAENRFMYIAFEQKGKTLCLVDKNDTGAVNHFKDTVKMDYVNYQKWLALAQPGNSSGEFFSLDQVKQFAGLS